MFQSLQPFAITGRDGPAGLGRWQRTRRHGLAAKLDSRQFEPLPGKRVLDTDAAGKPLGRRRKPVGKRVEGLGMAYVHIPVAFDGPQLSDLQQFFAAVEQAPGKVFVHCIANKRVSAFLFLYRVLKLGHPIHDAEMALHRIWQPDETWQAFIDRALRAGTN